MATASSLWSLEGTCVLRAPPFIPDAIAWSDDNQLLVRTPSIVYIITPQFKISAQQLATPLQRVLIFPYGVSTTAQLATSAVLDLSKRKFGQLPRPKNDYFVRVSEAMSETFRCAVWSPRGCSRFEGCLLLIISSSHRIQIYEPSGEPTTSAWQELLDMSNVVFEYYQIVHDIDHDAILNDGHQLDYLETTSVAWSYLAPKFSNVSRQCKAFISLGNKAGQVTLWNFLDDTLCHVHTIEAKQSIDVWVKKLAWSPWLHSDNRKFAYGNGAVELYIITAEIEDGVVRIHCSLCRSWFQTLENHDRKVVNLIQWISLQNGTSATKLVIIKSMDLYVWDLDDLKSMASITDDLYNMGSMGTIRIPKAAIVGGIATNVDGSLLTVYMTNGRAVVISLEQQLAIDQAMTALALHPLLIKHAALPSDTTAKTQAPKAEVKTETEADALQENGVAEGNEEEDNEEDTTLKTFRDKEARFFGVASSPNNLLTAVMYSIFNVDQLNYRTEKESPAFLEILFTTQIGNINVESDLLAQLECLVAQRDLLHSRSMHYLVWDIIQYITVDLRRLEQVRATEKLMNGNDQTTIKEPFLDRCLETLRHLYEIWGDASDDEEDAEDEHINSSMSMSKTGLSGMETLIRKRLHHSAATNTLRLMTFILSHALPLLPRQVRAIKDGKLNTYNQTLTGAYVMHTIDFILMFLKIDFANFHLRIDDASLQTIFLLMSFLLRNEWERDFSEEVDTMLMITSKLLEKDVTSTTTLWQHQHLDAWHEFLKQLKASPQRTACDAVFLPTIPEQCPACKTPLTTLSAFSDGICENGHKWGRCVITMGILASSSVRACVGCQRKSLESDPLPEESPTLRDILLYLNKYCGICGDRFCWRGRPARLSK